VWKVSEHNEAEALTRKIAEALHPDRWDRDTLEIILPILSDALAKKDEAIAQAQYDRRSKQDEIATLQADLATARAEVEESETRRAETVAMVTHLRADLAAKEAERRVALEERDAKTRRMLAAEARVREAETLIKRLRERYTPEGSQFCRDVDAFLHPPQPAEKPTAEIWLSCDPPPPSVTPDCYCEGNPRRAHPGVPCLPPAPPAAPSVGPTREKRAAWDAAAAICKEHGIPFRKQPALAATILAVLQATSEPSADPQPVTPERHAFVVGGTGQWCFAILRYAELNEAGIPRPILCGKPALDPAHLCPVCNRGPRDGGTDDDAPICTHTFHSVPKGREQRVEALAAQLWELI
jgi:hypothetical protein